MLDQSLIGFCGMYCGACDWKEKMDCKGCRNCAGNPFWGECEIAKCCIGKNFAHCGQCQQLPCKKLQSLFDDAENGDPGTRLSNLKGWAEGGDAYEKIENVSQEQARLYYVPTKE